MNGLIGVALIVGMFFTGSCIVNLMMQDYSEEIENPYDLTYAVAFLFGMLSTILVKMI